MSSYQCGAPGSLVMSALSQSRYALPEVTPNTRLTRWALAPKGAMVGVSPRKEHGMKPTAKLTALVATATVAVVGAGLALASVGPESQNSTAVAAQPSKLDGLTNQLDRLNSRSRNLQQQLKDVQKRADRIGNATATSGATTESGSYTTAVTPSPSVAQTEQPATRSEPSSDDSEQYNDDGPGDDQGFSDDDSTEVGEQDDD
jgi:hypothetical protein